MTDLVKLGAILTLLGFLAVGSGPLYLASLETPQQVLNAAKNMAVVQGLGWVLVGLGLAMALWGSDKSDLAIDTKSEILLGRLPAPARKFVCEKCGGDISEDAAVCPHCGSPMQ